MTHVFDKSKLPSRHVSVGPERAPHRSYYYAMGMTEEEINRPFVAIASAGNDSAPCNTTLDFQADLVDAILSGMKASGYAWPVIDMHVRYLQPATFGQDVIVRAEIVEWEHRLRMQYLIRDASSSLRLTKGSTVQVAVSLESKLMCLQSPSILFEKLGVPEPLSIYANCDGTEKCDLAKLEKRLGEVMDLRPRGIRTHLGLNKPIYARTAAYGHFGREPDADGGFSWEKTDIAAQLKDLA